MIKIKGVQLNGKITKEIEIYTVAGKEFLDKQEAINYEEEINKELEYTFFIIEHHPDLNEGTGYFNKNVIAVPKNYAEYATALQFCVNNFGKPLAAVQGVAPIPNWVMSAIKKFDNIEDLENFKKVLSL